MQNQVKTDQHWGEGGELADQLYKNLSRIGELRSGDKYPYAYIAGYLYTVLADVANKGVQELRYHVTFTNKLILEEEMQQRTAPLHF